MLEQNVDWAFFITCGSLLCSAPPPLSPQVTAAEFTLYYHHLPFFHTHNGSGTRDAPREGTFTLEVSAINAESKNECRAMVLYESQ